MVSKGTLSLIYFRLRIIVKDEIKKAFELYLEKLKDDSSTANGDFLSSEQAAKFLKIKLNTLYAKVEKGDLPFYRAGNRKLLFAKEELVKYIVERKG